MDPQFSVHSGNTFEAQPAASRSVSAGLWLIFGCHQTIMTTPSYGFLLPHLFTWQQTRAANQTGTIQTVRWESDTKGLRNAARNSCSTYAPRQLPPGKHGKCHSLKLSWFLSCEEPWCENTEHKEIPHLDVPHTVGVFVCFRGALGDTTSCSALPKVGVQAGLTVGSDGHSSLLKAQENNMAVKSF